MQKKIEKTILHNIKDDDMICLCKPLLILGVGF
jgi:hypothetical protein